MSKSKKYKLWLLLICPLLIMGLPLTLYVYASTEQSRSADEKPVPVIVDGDIVEYLQDKNEVKASGNVVVTYEDSRLTCEEIIVNTRTKEAQASGHVRIEDKRGVLETENLTYNLETKSGAILEGKLRTSPYYSFGKNIERVNEDKYELKQGYFSTCNYDQPHYRLKSKRVEIYPGDKVIGRQNTLYWHKFPFFYLPYYRHSLKDPFMKLQVQPGKTSNWGPYVLTASRFYLSESVCLRLYLDWRERLGWAEGFGINYATSDFGGGDYKFYYTQERISEKVEENLRREYQRYFVRLRHQWEIDEKTNLTAQYYLIRDGRRGWDKDARFLKDYFYREYERDMQPSSYVLVTRSLPNSSLNLLLQKRTNNWYDKETEKLPEISYDLPNYRIDQSHLYFKNQTAFSNLTNKNPPAHLPYNTIPADAGKDDDVVRFDTYNQITLPTRISFLQIAPYLALRETVYSKDKKSNSISPRGVFYTGTDITTKFYRIFKLKSNLLGLDINDLRHIITPKIKYGYIHEPTISYTKLQEFDDIDTIAEDNRFTLEIENKLQTKRKEATVDLVTLRLSSDYIMYCKKAGISTGQDRFTDFLFDLELRPYSWLRMEADATYDHLNDYFKTANFDSWFDFGHQRSLGLGHRYQRSGGKEMTSQLIWRLNPKWKFRIYERYQFAKKADYKSGLREQEYTISRDLHCATIDISFNSKKKITGKKDESIWCVFNLKIFKESEFDYAHYYYPPKEK